MKFALPFFVVLDGQNDGNGLALLGDDLRFGRR